MNFYFVTTPASELRRNAREALRGKWGLAFGIGIVYSLLSDGVMAVVNALSGYYGKVADLTQNIATTFLPGSGDFATYSVNDASAYLSYNSGISGAYGIIIGGALAFGLARVALMFLRRQNPEINNLFAGFQFVGKCIILQLLIFLFIFLWAILLVVPGIIAAIRYSQAFFYLAENPNISAREALNLSKQSMRGNKGKYFCLILSFIGWLLLAGLASSILNTVLNGMAVSANVVGMTTDITSAIGSGFIIIYMQTACAGFYSIVNGLMEGQQLAGPYVGVEEPPSQAQGSANQTEESAASSADAQQTADGESQAGDAQDVAKLTTDAPAESVDAEPMAESEPKDEDKP